MWLKAIPRAGWLIVIAALIFCATLALDLIPGLRGDQGWRWPYEAPEPARIVPLALALAIYLGGAVALGRSRRWWAPPAWATFGAILITVAALQVTEADPLDALFTRTVSSMATGPHTAAAEIAPDVGAALRDWPARMESYVGRSIHVALAPPGLPLIYAAANRALEAAPSAAHTLSMALRPYQCHNLELMAYTDPQLASAWLGVLMPLWAGLAAWSIYGVGRRIGDHAAGARAALWWPLVPGAVMFTPTWNTFYPLMSTGALWLLSCRGAARGAPTERREAWRAFLAGLIAGLATFMNFSLVPLLMLLGLYVLLDDRLMRRVSWRESITTGVWVGAGATIPWALYWLFSGLTPVSLLTTAMNQHFTLDRAYLPWLWLHLYDFALFVGLPLMALALWQLAGIARQGRAAITRADVLGVSLAATLLTVDVLDLARGETGRVWLFFAPFVLVVGAFAPLSPSPPGGASRVPGRAQSVKVCRAPTKGNAWLAVTIVQAATLLTLVSFLRVMSTELTPPPAYPPPGDPSPTARPVAADFGNVMTLSAFDGWVEEREEVVHLRLRWEARARTGVAYWFSALLVGPNGAIGGKVDWQPGASGRPPTTCWVPGDVIQDEVTIPLAGLAPRDVWVSLRAFDLRTGEQLPVTVGSAPGAPADEQIGLGPINPR